MAGVFKLVCVSVTVAAIVGLRLEVDDPGAGARSVIVGAVMSTLKEYEAACPMLLAESVAFTLKV